MSEFELKLVKQLVEKLGLDINQHLIIKSTEFLRLLALKSNTNVNNMGDYARTVICIELATVALSQSFDLDAAYRLSGLKKSAYNNNKRTIEKLLDLNRCIGINEICVKLGLNQVQKTAVDLLKRYKSTGGKPNEDLDHPQYAAMACYFACRQHSVKVAKQKLLSLSQLRPSQWTLLENVWEKWLKQQTKPNNEKNVDKIEDIDDENVEPKSEDKLEVEDYEIWSERMLRKAYADLESKRLKLLQTIE